ncbi:MAG TPA: DUF1080 domain-containing protein [Gemmataceae bacterium]|nr:DUF1080 domain-containing protein [Gemmataceae bacterium]
MISSTKKAALIAVALVLGLLTWEVIQLTAQDKNLKGVWTDPNDPSLPPDFKIQGEYVGEAPGVGKLGCQVISLGNGAFQAVVYPGGLPGDGWDGKNKILMDGRLEGSQAVFKPATGNKKYLARSAEEFSATSKFPPVGQKNYSATISGETLSGKTEDGRPFELRKTVRKSPTLGAKPPAGAVVLFDGTNTNEWIGGRLDKEKGTLNTDGKDILSKRKFNNYTMHLEFLLPYRPEARGQQRGNSGFYQVDHYEVQILDSFGLDGKNNECGGIYSKVEPKVNMCYPPLTWQTYDVEFTNAVRGEDGKKVRNARITLRHNGVVIHDNVEIDGPTGGHRSEPEGTPGPIKLQGHGNPLQFRNIWVVEKK